MCCFVGISLMCTQAAYAVVLNTEHFVFHIFCKHKNKLNQLLFSSLCWLKKKKMHLCSKVLEVRQLCQKPAKRREHTTARSRNIHVFIGKGTHTAQCLGEAGCRTSRVISFSLFPTFQTNDSMLLQWTKTFLK